MRATGYIVLSDAGSMRLAKPDRQASRYGLVLYWGAAATVFPTLALADAALARTLAYRHEMYRTRLDRDRRRYWVVRLGPTWDGPLPRVPPLAKKRKAAR